MKTKEVNSFIEKAKIQLEYLTPKSLVAYYNLKNEVIKYHAIFNNLGKEAQMAIDEIQENTDIENKQIAHQHYTETFFELFNIQEKVNNFTVDDYKKENQWATDEKIKDFYDFKPNLIWGLNNSIAEIKKEIEKLKKSNSKVQNPTFTPETVKLKNWIEFKKITLFTEIEQGLFDYRYIDENYKWQKSQKDLVEFLIVINEYKFFRVRVKGCKQNAKHYRWFISERYGYHKTWLSDTSNKYKPNFEYSLKNFTWIENLKKNHDLNPS